MRVRWVLWVMLSCLVVAAATAAEARPSPRRAARAQRHGKPRRVAVDKDARIREAARRDATAAQSIGTPWGGHLAHATRFRIGAGAHVRRPQRTYATRTTVEHVRRAIRDTRRAFPRTHVLAIGDFSAERGGWISEHASHRSGRDVDLGLFYAKRPAGYPARFVRATEANLDRAATWALLANLLNTAEADGGVQMVFLDFEVQGMLYRWARAHGISRGRLDRVFQYPHGRGAAAGIVRHEPNHADHLHVRFRCAKADTGCW